MKNKITGLVLLTIVIVSSAFANKTEDNINRKVFSSFTQKFIGAKEVSWSNTENYVKASFTFNEQVMFAYFTPSGELMGASRNILASRLPINLQIELKKHYSSAWLTELFEFSTDEGTLYYATIENADQKIKLQSIGSSSWSVSKKINKFEP